MLYALKINGNTIDRLTLAQVIERHGSVQNLENAGFVLAPIADQKPVKAIRPAAACKVLPLIKPTKTAAVLPTAPMQVIRPDYSTAEVKARAAALTFDARRTSDLAQAKPAAAACPVIELYTADDKTLDLAGNNCPFCAEFLSKCYCVKSA